MDKLDFKKALKPLYLPSAKEVSVVDIPALNYLMVDGRGDPNTSADYQHAVQALFSVAYATKFAAKKGPLQTDYGVMPLEGLWWADDLRAFAADDKANWQWTMMIMQPDCVPDALLRDTIAQVRKKKDLPALERLRIERWTEGRCAQILHVGPFTEEGPTIARLHACIDARSGLRGKHHEIYLSDIRRSDPANWKTILRQPMA